MGFALCLCRSALRLASSVCGGRVARVRSISTVVNRPSLSPSPAAIDDWISSEQAVLGEIHSEFYDPVIIDEKDLLGTMFAHMWRNGSTKPMTPHESFPFKVEDIPGNPTVTFTREYNEDHIKVVASMPNVYEDDGPSNESKDDDGPSNEPNDDDDDDDDDNDDGIPLVVTVTKKSGLSLEFSCMALGNEFAIDALYVNLPGYSLEDPKVIRGLDAYKGLDENLKKTFNKYLEVRGLDQKTSLTLRGYMLYKIKREYGLLLNYFKEFLEEGRIDS